jgi:hypothetical protein
VIFKEMGQERCWLYSVRKRYAEIGYSALEYRKRDRKDIQRVGPGRETGKIFSGWAQEERHAGKIYKV